MGGMKQHNVFLGNMFGLQIYDLSVTWRWFGFRSEDLQRAKPDIITIE